MTYKNADVEWLRRTTAEKRKRFSGQYAVAVGAEVVTRILAHIDQLEADRKELSSKEQSLLKAIDEFSRTNCRLEDELETLRVAEQECGRQQVGPNVHEIAVRMCEVFTKLYGAGEGYDSRARHSYDLAEALIAEGRRRDGD